MNFPALPTDTLYKFLTISGVVLVVSSIYFSTENKIDEFKEAESIRREIDAQKTNVLDLSKSCGLDESGGHNSGVDTMAKPERPLKVRLEYLKIKREKMLGKMVYPTAGFDNDAWSLAYINAQIQCMEEAGKINEAINRVSSNSSSLERLMALNTKRNHEMQIIFILGWIMMLLGFVLWYFKKQSIDDKLLRIELSEKQRSAN
ncbi:MAG: hypothetical protein IPO40_12660 [Fibrobacteres bacterium]|nr:hypothetical protein [Fibrobacterota bacterium]